MTEKPVAGESMTPGKRLVWGLASTWSVQIVGTSAILGVPVLAPVIAPEMGVDPTWIGLFVSLIYLTGQVTGLMAGGFTDRYGALRLSQISCLFAALGILALMPASAWLAPVAAILMGCSYGPLNPTSSKILRGLGNPRRQPFIFSIKQTGVPVAGVLVGAVLPVLAVAYGWRAAFCVFAVLGLIVALAIQPVRETFDHDRQRDGGRPKIRIWGPLKLVMGEPVMRALCLIGFALAGAQICVASFYVLYLTHAQGWSLVDAGFIYAVVQAGGVFGRLFWGAVANQFLSPTRVIVGVSFLVFALFVLAAVMTPDWPAPVAVGLSFLLGLSSFGWNGVWLSEVTNAAPQDRIGDATGGTQFVMFGGVTVVPPVFGVLVDLTGSYVTPFIAAGVFVVFLAVHLGLVRRRIPVAE